MPAGPDTVNYYGGITSASFSLNGATLETAPGDPASVLVTMLDTPPVLGIPGFHDGYSFTAGGASDSQGRRWALNVFFYGFNGGLPDLDAPSSLPDLSNFAVGGRLSVVPAPRWADPVLRWVRRPDDFHRRSTGTPGVVVACDRARCGLAAVPSP